MWSQQPDLHLDIIATNPARAPQIVLATNIAETAITIDDIVCVINSGRLKEKSFDPYTSVSTLQVNSWDVAGCSGRFIAPVPAFRRAHVAISDDERASVPT